MTARPIEQALKALANHAEVVESLLSGGAVEAETIGRAAMLALRQANALRPAAEGNWRLHPRLREYLQDHQQLASPFPTMTDLAPRVAKLRAFLDAAHDAQHARDSESLLVIMEQMQIEIWDIEDMAERNLRVLGRLMNIRYGDVKSYRAKLDQNRWFTKRAAELADDLNSIRVRAEVIERDCEERRWPVARVLRRSLLEPLPRWNSQLSAIQAQLRQEQFRLREVQQNARNLARMDSFLAQNLNWSGLEVELQQSVEQLPPFLLRTALAAIVSHPDPEDTDPRMRREMVDLAHAIPLQPVIRKAPPSPRIKPVRDVGEEVVEPDVYLVALRHFARAVLQCGERLSVLGWAATSPHAAALRRPSPTAVRPSNWLMFVATSLDGSGGRTHTIAGQSVCFEVLERPTPRPAGSRMSHSFDDAWVSVASAQPLARRKRQAAPAANVQAAAAAG